MEIKLKLERYDRHEGVYDWCGLKVFGYQHAIGEYRWSFPRMKVNKAWKEKISKSYILEKYDIPMFGNSPGVYFREDAKEDLEKELTTLMEMPMNQYVLIHMLFNEILIIGDDDE